MEKENMEGTGGGMPEAPAPLPTHDDDVNISRPGPKIALVVILLLVIGGGAYFYFGMMVPKQELNDSIVAFKSDFQKVHDNGYEAFWKESQIDIKEMKDNKEFEAKLNEILAVSAVAYSTHLRDNAMPILDKAIPEYKALQAPVQIATEAQAVTAAAEGMQTAWKDFQGQVDKYEEYLAARKELTESGNHWLGIQGDHENAKFRVKAVNYLNMARCIMVDKIAFEMEPDALRGTLEDSCKGEDDKRLEWFSRVISDCMPKLLQKNSEADEYFTKTLDKYRKSEMPDTGSVFGVENCLDKGREALEYKLASDLFKARIDYGKAQNALLTKVKEELEKLK